MDFNYEKIGNAANKIKTPLSLAALVLVIMYGIIKTILSLDIFSRIDDASTYSLMSGIIDKLFWLAVIAVVLGAGSYIVPIYIKRKRNADIEIIDQHLIDNLDNNMDKSYNDRD